MLSFCCQAETNEWYIPWLLGSLLKLAIVWYMPFPGIAER